MTCRSGLPDSLRGMLDMLDRRAPASRIDLGLERVQHVLDRLRIDLGATRVITVGGTNGKGSTVAFIEAIALASGRRCMSFTSPHVIDFNERFRLDGKTLPESRIAEALRCVERARGEVALTWFEQVALAAFWLADESRPDWLVLEVGLGGRLDAVNAIDADVAVITSIGLDHQSFLGRTRSAIALEKCGIARAGRPLVVGEKRPPNGMLDRIRELGAIPILAGRQFSWRWSSSSLAINAGGRRLRGLTPGLGGRHQGGNAAAAVAAVVELDPAVDDQQLSLGIERARLIGRFQQIACDPTVWVDVAHNPAAARVLRDQLSALPGRKFAVFAALGDKDVATMARVLRPVIESWFPAALEGPRGLSAGALSDRIRSAGVEASPDALESVAEALERARAECRDGDSVIVFGSFLTVAAAFDAISRRNTEVHG